MATVNFSVPDAVKDAFNKAFEGENKSAIVAQLMRRAVEEKERQMRRKQAIRTLTDRRRTRPVAAAAAVRAAREEGRS